MSAINRMFDKFLRKLSYSGMLKLEAFNLALSVFPEGNIKGWTYDEVACIALRVAAERISCPISPSLLGWRCWRMPKLLTKFREVSPRKDRDYYLKCAFGNILRGLMKESMPWSPLLKPGTPSRIYEEVFFLLSLLPKTWVSGRNPTTLMGGLCYLVFNLEGVRVTARDIHRVLGINEVTIRNNYRKIYKLLIRNPKVPEEIRESLFRLPFGKGWRSKAERSIFKNCGKTYLPQK